MSVRKHLCKTFHQIKRQLILMLKDGKGTGMTANFRGQEVCWEFGGLCSGIMVLEAFH